MPNYTVHYGFSNEDANAADKKFGYGKIQINTDLPVETEEHRIEIARHIGKEHGYTQVGVMDVVPSDHFTDDSETVYEGEIVI